MRTGFLGLGGMGAPMARNLARAGLLNAVWNRTPDQAATLAEELGVHCAASPAQLAEHAELILTCVSADADVLAVIDQLLPALTEQHIVVDHSTISADTARQAALRVATRGATFLDAPVSGGVEGARNAQLVIMVGGDSATVERARPALEAMSKKIAHLGPVGNGQATKAVNQIMCAGIAEAVTEALAFGATQGLNLDQVIDVVSGGAAGNWFLEKRGPTMVRDLYPAGFKLAHHHKDLNICLAMAERAGFAAPVTTITRDHYAQLMKQGHGDEDISALYRIKSARS